MGQMLGTGSSLAGLAGGSGSTSYTGGSLDGTISLGLDGKINTDGVISGSATTVGIASPTFSLSDFDLKNSHLGQGVWNLKTTPKVYRMDYVAYDYANTYHQKDYFLNRPYFFDPSSIEVELNPDVFPESQIEWMEVDAICGASADKQYRPKDDALHLTGNAALRDAYGVVTPAPEGYGGPSDVTNKFVKDKKTCLWDFLYNMNDKHGMDELYTILDLSTIYISKLQGRGKNGFAIEPQIAGGYLQDGYYYIQYPFLEVNVKVKVKMRGMENPIVLSRNYLPDIVDYGDGSDFDDSRRHSRPYQSKMSGHTDLYDYQMKRIDDILKLYRTPTVGDLYYSDGTYSKTLEPGKTPIGVIAYVGAPTDADNDIVEYYQGGAGHGLVLCLKNAANSVKWSTEKVSKLSWKLTDLAGLMRIENVVSGYLNTAKLAADAAKYPAAAAAKNYKELPAPAGTTGWFLPSAQQWVRMMMSLGGLDESKIEWRNTFDYDLYVVDKWERALKKAGSGKYDSMIDGNYTFWTSSECSAEEALMLDITQPPRGFMFMPTTKGSEYISTRVRPILAF